MRAVRFEPRFLFLSADPALVDAQLRGSAVTLDAALPLRDDISTDEISPLPPMVHFGAQMLQPACGACANCGPGSSTDAAQVTVSAINRNFPGRSGPGQVWLASPATVAASAMAGHLSSFAELRDNPR